MMNRILEKTESPLLAVTKADNLPVNSEVIAEKTLVLYDECGDTMWDPVLAQDSRTLPSHPLQEVEQKC